MTREEEIQQESHQSLNKESIPDNNYIAFEKGFCIGAKWADKTMVEKACLWLSLNADVFGYFKKKKSQEMVYEFGKAMEGGEE